jgi:multiple sugar transport system substrate-binding protein
VATQLSGAWLLGHLQNWMAPDTKGKWGASNLPNGIFGSWGGSFLAIPKQAKNKKDAWEFIKYLTSTSEAQIEDVVLNGALAEVLNDGKDVMAALKEAEALVKRRVK